MITFTLCAKRKRRKKTAGVVAPGIGKSPPHTPAPTDTPRSDQAICDAGTRTRLRQKLETAPSSPPPSPPPLLPPPPTPPPPFLLPLLKLLAEDFKVRGEMSEREESERGERERREREETPTSHFEVPRGFTINPSPTPSYMTRNDSTPLYPRPSLMTCMALMPSPTTSLPFLALASSVSTRSTCGECRRGRRSACTACHTTIG